MKASISLSISGDKSENTRPVGKSLIARMVSLMGLAKIHEHASSRGVVCDAVLLETMDASETKA